MIDDHTKLQNSVNDLGEKRGGDRLPAPRRTLHTAAMAKTKKLRGLSGKAFDKEYIDREVDYHQQVIDAAAKC